MVTVNYCSVDASFYTPTAWRPPLTIQKAPQMTMVEEEEDGEGLRWWLMVLPISIDMEKCQRRGDRVFNLEEIAEEMKKK